MWRPVHLAAAVAMLAVSAFAVELQLPPDFRPILDLASSTSPEFQAQALLRMVASGKISDKATRKELCIRAFEIASGAHERMARRVIRGAGVDSEAGALDEASRLGLDALTLQSRAVTLLLPDDPRKARDLFTQIPKPSIPGLTCKDALVYDVSKYFEAAQGVAGKSFPEAERQKEYHVAFLLEILSTVTSPSQLVPAARLVLNTEGLSQQQRDLLVTRYNGILENMPSDYRAFAAAVAELSSTVTPAMQPSLTKLMARVKTGTVCADPDPAGWKPVAGTNTPSPDTLPETQPFWHSSGSKAILATAKTIRFGKGTQMWTEADRQTADWRDQYTGFLGTLQTWTPDSDESAAVNFHERAILYQGLIDVAPTPELRLRVLEDFVSFVNASTLQRENPPEWFGVVPNMWTRIPFREVGEQAAAAEAFTRTGNPVLALYLLLNKTIPEMPGAPR